MIADLENKVLLVTEETIDTYVSENEDFKIWQMVADRFHHFPVLFVAHRKVSMLDVHYGS